MGLLTMSMRFDVDEPVVTKCCIMEAHSGVHDLSFPARQPHF